MFDENIPAWKSTKIESHVRARANELKSERADGDAVHHEDDARDGRV